MLKKNMGKGRPVVKVLDLQTGGGNHPATPIYVDFSVRSDQQ
jgi:hypothetical protein